MISERVSENKGVLTRVGMSACGTRLSGIEHPATLNSPLWIRLSKGKRTAGPRPLRNSDAAFGRAKPDLCDLATPKKVQGNATSPIDPFTTETQRNGGKFNQE